MGNKIEDFSSYCQVVGQTDVGRKRAANEDFLGQAVTPNGLVAVVCDGMGGHVGGATASHIAVEAVLEYLQQNYRQDARLAITEAIDAANNAILAHAAAHPELQGMGSTCVLLLVRNGSVYIGHVGDSRIYLVRSRTIRQLTKDHSYVQMLVDNGQITKEEAEHHPRKNEITNALGIPNMQPATVLEDAINPEAGDCFLLCSDGLSGMVSDHEIEKIVSRQREMRAQERADRLIEAACQNGGLDNVTVELVEFSVTPKSAPASAGLKPSGSLSKPVILGAIAALVLCLIGGGIWYWLSSHKDTAEEAVLAEQSATGLPIFRKSLPDVINPDLSGTIVVLNFEETATTISTEEGVVLWNEGFKFDKDSVKVVKGNIRSFNSDNITNLMTKGRDEKVADGDTCTFTLQNETCVYEFSFVVRAKEVEKVNESAKPQSETPKDPKELLKSLGSGSSSSAPEATTKSGNTPKNGQAAGKAPNQPAGKGQAAQSDEGTQPTPQPTEEKPTPEAPESKPATPPSSDSNTELNQAA